MTAFQIRHTPDGFQVYATETGLDRRDVGQPFRSPRLAGQYADVLSGKPISPLRHPVTRPAEELAGAGSSPARVTGRGIPSRDRA